MTMLKEKVKTRVGAAVVATALGLGGMYLNSGFSGASM